MTTTTRGKHRQSIWQGFAPIATALFALVLLIVLTACGGTEPDLDACEDAMRKQFAESLTTGAEGERPAACEGVSDTELEEIALKVMGEAFE
jgi:hypothetical protein